MSAPSAPVAHVSFADLQSGGNDGHVLSQIERAFGDHVDCLGIITVRDIPEYERLREKLLPLAQRVATLPEDKKEKLVNVQSGYNVGWSHGKEKFQGRYDTAKGSFYANPQYNAPSDNPEEIKAFPSYFTPNVWPSEDIPELEEAFKELGSLIVKVGQALAKYCDAYVSSKVPDYEPQYLQNMIATSHTAKARLLHYFPYDSSTDEEGKKIDQDAWCGWHFDHGALTGLTSAMFLDPSYTKVSCPDPNAGLYIRSRGGDIVKVSIGAGELAFQMGEVAEIGSGGHLRATRHCVRAPFGAEMANVSRNTLAVFMQPNVDHVMRLPQGTDPSTITVVGWKAGQTFDEFSQEKFKTYY